MMGLAVSAGPRVAICQNLSDSLCSSAILRMLRVSRMLQGFHGYCATLLGFHEILASEGYWMQDMGMGFNPKAKEGMLG